MKKQWTTVLDFIQHGKVTSKYQIVEVQGMNTVGDGGALTLVRTGAVGTPSQSFIDTGNNTCVDKNGDVWGLQEGTIIAFNGSDDWFGNSFGSQEVGNYELKSGSWGQAEVRVDKGPYASGITLESKFEYITYNGESYFATNPPYTTTATTPNSDGNLFVGDYLTSQQLSLYTDIVYKASGGNSAVDNMIAGAVVGEICSSEGSIFERLSNTNGNISDFNRISQDAFYKFGTFVLGASITKSDQALLHSDGFYYAYHGDLSSPLVINPGDSPVTLPNGNWSCVGLLNGYPINNAFNYGITESSTYDPQQAWENRTAIQLMCQNMFFSEFDIDGRGNTLWMLSTVHPLRSNITVRINAGCKMRGRYNDPSIPQSLISQSGGMIGMVLYADPDNDDFTVVGTIINSTVVVDGDVSTEFSLTHNRPHSNLCIGFFKARNCRIIGDGGVSESDHKGLNFDGDCQDCEIDVAYVRGTSNQPLTMKGDPAKTFSVNKVKCKSVSEIKFDGGQPFDVVFSRDNAIIEIEIGSYQWNGVDKGQLVSSGGDVVCDVKFGSVLGLNQIVRHSDSKFVTINSLGISNKCGSFQLCDNICTRVDATPDILKDVTITGLRAFDDLVSVFQSENRVSNFRRLTISNNDFEEAGSVMKTFDLEFGDNKALTTNCFENVNPLGFTPQYVNKINKESDSLITGTPTTFDWDYTSPDWNYSFVTMLINDGGNGVFQGVMSIEARRLTSIDTTFNVAGIPVTVQRTGTVFTFTASSGTFLLVRAHN